MWLGRGRGGARRGRRGRGEEETLKVLCFVDFFLSGTCGLVRGGRGGRGAQPPVSSKNI